MADLRPIHIAMHALVQQQERLLVLIYVVELGMLLRLLEVGIHLLWVCFTVFSVWLRGNRKISLISVVSLVCLL